MLPVLSVPVFDVNLPSNGKKIQIRPYLVKEQKILLMAQFSDSEMDVFSAIKTVLESCIVTPGIDVGKLPRFDVEYLFLKLRSKSVSELIELSYKCMNTVNDKECGGSFKHTLDVEKLTVPVIRDKKNGTITLTPEVGIKVKYPSFEVLEKYSSVISEEGRTELDKVFSLIYECTENVYTKDEVFTEFGETEFVTWMETLSDKQFSKIMEFFDHIPKLHYEIPFKCPVCGYEEKIELSSLADFFA